MSVFMKRRRLIKLMAASCLMGSLPNGARAFSQQNKSELYKWQGFALGAEVSLQLYHTDGNAARRIIQNARKIIDDMEGLFSLYRQDSVLSRLNRLGAIDNPPADFVDLLQMSHRVSRMTSGAFDVTVQPLWQFYKDFFSSQGRGADPLPNALRALQDKIGYEKLQISPDRIAFDQTGMAVTLNGIAQGYVTDRVADYLKSEGMTSVLVDIGEYRALGPQADQSPWRIGLMDPIKLGQFSDILEITDGAVATSSGQGDVFDGRGTYHHLFDPHSGKSADRYLSVTVTAQEAALADALSTAFYAMSMAAIKDCLKVLPLVNARLTDKAGAVIMV